jgi:hypothetical protein
VRRSYPEGEKREMVDILKGKGFEEADASELINIMATPQHRDFFIDYMVRAAAAAALRCGAVLRWCQGHHRFPRARLSLTRDTPPPPARPTPSSPPSLL